MSKLFASIGSNLLNLDMFGHPVTLFYKGSDVYKTKLGALMSIGVLILSWSYLYVRIVSLVEMSDPEVLIMRKGLLKNMKSQFSPMNLDEAVFNMGLAVVDKNKNPLEIPTDIGKFVM
jgi:hypothetical protein